MGKWHLLYRQPSLGSAPAARCHLKVCQHGMQWVQPKNNNNIWKDSKILKIPMGVLTFEEHFRPYIQEMVIYILFSSMVSPFGITQSISILWASTNVPDVMRSIAMYTSQRWTPLVVHWVRVRLPMEGTQVQSLVWEPPTCCEATKPMRHNYWACAPQPKKAS